VSTWWLYRQEELIAELVVTGSDFPWLEARVEPRRGLEALRPLFAEELALVESDRLDDERWEAVHRRLRRRLRLVDPDGGEPAEFLLHVDGDKAWWRWNEEPFNEGWFDAAGYGGPSPPWLDELRAAASRWATSIPPEHSEAYPRGELIITFVDVKDGARILRTYRVDHDGRRTLAAEVAAEDAYEGSLFGPHRPELCGPLEEVSGGAAAAAWYERVLHPEWLTQRPRSG
jgi:hypothetical protein